MEIVSRHYMYAIPQRDTQVFLQTFSAPRCKHPLLISALPRNGVHYSLETELRIRIAMEH